MSCWWAAGSSAPCSSLFLYGRELAPDRARVVAGLLTTGYAIGQLVGPVTSALSTRLAHRLEPALGLAGSRCSLAGVGLEPSG